MSGADGNWMVRILFAGVGVKVFGFYQWDLMVYYYYVKGCITFFIFFVVLLIIMCISVNRSCLSSMSIYH